MTQRIEIAQLRDSFKQLAVEVLFRPDGKRALLDALVKEAWDRNKADPAIDALLFMGERMVRSGRLDAAAAVEEFFKPLVEDVRFAQTHRGSEWMSRCVRFVQLDLPAGPEGQAELLSRLIRIDDARRRVPEDEVFLMTKADKLIAQGKLDEKETVAKLFVPIIERQSKTVYRDYVTNLEYRQDVELAAELMQRDADGSESSQQEILVRFNNLLEKDRYSDAEKETLLLGLWDGVDNGLLQVRDVTEYLIVPYAFELKEPEICLDMLEFIGAQIQLASA